LPCTGFAEPDAIFIASPRATWHHSPPARAADRQLYTAGLAGRLIASLLPAIDSGSLDRDLLGSLHFERSNIEAKIAELQEAHRRLDLLISLAAHPDTTPCPATLDQPTALEVG